MSIATNLMQVLVRFMADEPIGNVYPPRTDAPNLPDKGAREHALRKFCDFLSCLPFMRTMDGPAQPFVVPRDQIFINQPEAADSAPNGRKTPWIAFLSSDSDDSADDSFLGPAVIDDDTADVYAPDTAVFWLGDHVEELQIEVVASGVAVRRAIVEGIKQVLRQSENGNILKLALPDYFDQVAQFTLVGTRYEEDQYAVLNRRRALIRVRLYVPEVALASAVDIHPSIQTCVVARTEILEPPC